MPPYAFPAEPQHNTDTAGAYPFLEHADSRLRYFVPGAFAYPNRANRPRSRSLGRVLINRGAGSERPLCPSKRHQSGHLQWPVRARTGNRWACVSTTGEPLAWHPVIPERPLLVLSRRYAHPFEEIQGIRVALPDLRQIVVRNGRTSGRSP